MKFLRNFCAFAFFVGVLQVLELCATTENGKCYQANQFPMRAVVLGGSGQVGGPMVQSMINDESYSEILMVNRRHLVQYEGIDKVKQLVISDLTNVYSELLPLLQNGKYQAAFMALGAGKARLLTPEELTRVDLDIPTAFARACKEAGISHFSLLTSAGADHTQEYSRWTGTGGGGGFYLQIKGRLENAVKDMKFPFLHILRPGAILGNDNTPGFVQWLAPKIGFLVPNNWREIHSVDLGRAMKDAPKIQCAAEGDVPVINTWEGLEITEVFGNTQ
eukprot:TRINITY_DN53540_c0_g1_i1.p2 TRINITY_DN53540_c0_g1~~TRINITY_DN53540_c0_g1_i1.p2  ORF type:complete len:276 (+),score=28.85 TRINITY_DN53540_c0_g1_i1:30-857(+)